MQNYPPTPYYPQDSPYRHSRRRKRTRRHAFHPTVTDDLDLDDLYDDDFYPPQNAAPAPYWGHPQPYGSYPPPPPYYPPYPPYPQYPPQYPGSGGYDPRRPESNFGMLLSMTFVFAFIVFGALWYNNSNKPEGVETSVSQDPRSSYEPPTAPVLRTHPTPPKPYLKPITRDLLAVFIEAYGTEAEVNNLAIDLQRSDITPVKMGNDTYWACIIAESEAEAEQIKAEIVARYEQNQWEGDPYLINLKANCEGLEWRGNKLVCGEK